ncbi:hypothetical protein CBS101457_000944 [Exobasidium rhododendri]|nr:hypothetical protein CBS101457_000944 [Exobasidium rhododendri]
MGRSNHAFFDDLLLQKTKGVVCQVLKELNESSEIEFVQALSSRETNERYSNVTGVDASTLLEIDRARKGVTYEHFVENLDGQDQLVKNLVELLVSETVRKAIVKSMDHSALSKYCQDFVVPVRAEIESEWTKSCERSGKLRVAMNHLTKANRRSSGWVDGYHSPSSSSSSSSSSGSDLTVTPYDITSIGMIPRAPPSVLPSVMQVRGRGETTRHTRNERAAAMLDSAASRSRRSELMTQRTRLSNTARARSRQAQIREMRNARRSRVEEVMRGARSSFATPATTTSDPEVVGEDGGEEEDDPTANLVHRFLTQPFPSDSRSMSVRADRNGISDSALAASEMDLLNSIYGDTEDILPRSPHTAIPDSFYTDAGQDDAANPQIRSTDSEVLEEERDSRRWGDFETFANASRLLQRNRHESEADTLVHAGGRGANDRQEDARETDTFYRALNNLFRADETIREVTQSAEANSAETSNRGARRFDLSSWNDSRPVVRLPIRAQGGARDAAEDGDASS